MGFQHISKEERKKIQSMGGKASNRLGKLTPEERKKIASMGGKASGPGAFALVPGLASRAGKISRVIKVKHEEKEEVIDVKRKLEI